jgi:hypothetical protein
MINVNVVEPSWGNFSDSWANSISWATMNIGMGVVVQHFGTIWANSTDTSCSIQLSFLIAIDCMVGNIVNASDKMTQFSSDAKLGVQEGQDRVEHDRSFTRRIRVFGRAQNWTPIRILLQLLHGRIHGGQKGHPNSSRRN